MKYNGIRTLAACVAMAAIIGGASTAHASFDGFGKDIPLESAARQIAPEGTDVTFGQGVDASAPVSWSGAADWQGALRAAVARKGYAAEIEGSSVRIVKAEAPPRSAPAPRPYSSSPSDGAVQKKRPGKSRPAPAPRPTVQEEAYKGGGGFSIRPYRGQGGTMVGKGDEPSSKAAAPASVFSVKPGQMLHPVLADWAASAGWELVWNSEFDYRLDAQASFGGDFIQAVTSLADAMADARPTITVDFYRGNKVVVISNKSADAAN